MNVSGNIAYSRNKVLDFTEYIDDYDNGGQKENKYSSTDIAYSPNIVGTASINFLPCEKFEISLLSKYVGKQYLDNTQNQSRKLDAFYVQDLRAIYTFNYKLLKEINLIVQINNIFDEKYEPNGYTFSYIYGGTETTENYYFPMAGRNFMLGINVRL
jgi:iron complex outermembrane receptor protein